MQMQRAITINVNKGDSYSSFIILVMKKKKKKINISHQNYLKHYRQCS